MSYAQLTSDGFLFTQTGLPVAVMRAPFGDGYAAPAALIGAPLGTRGWAVKIAAMNKVDRAEYLWQFFQARKREGDAVFWLQDPKDDLYYLASFVDDELSFELLCATLFSTGLQLRQGRVKGQPSPVSVLEDTAPPWPIWGETEWGSQ